MAASKAHASLREQLRAGALRLRLNDGLKWCLWGALAAVCGMAVLVLLHRLVYLDAPIQAPAADQRADLGFFAYYAQGALAWLRLPWWALLAMLGLVLIPLITGAAGYLFSSKGVLAAAMAADQRLGLRARLSSAVAMEGRAAGSVMMPELYADAQRHAAALRARRDFPIRAPRHLRWLAVGLILPLALVIPQADIFGREAKIRKKKEGREQVRLAVKTVEKQLQEALKRKASKKQTGKSLPSQQLDDELSKLVKEMKEAQDREQALTKLNKLMDKAKTLEMRMAAMAEMMRRMEELRKLGKDADLPDGQLQKAAGAMVAGDIGKAAQELKKLVDKLKNKDEKLSKEEREKLKRELEKLAKMTDDWKNLSDQLRKAANDLEQGGDGLEGMQQALEGLDELAKLLKELGIEGAEGLAGQGQQIQLTQEMIDQLKKMLQNAQKCAKCKKVYCLGCNRPRCACEGLEQCDCPPGGQ